MKQKIYESTKKSQDNIRHVKVSIGSKKMWKDMTKEEKENFCFKKTGKFMKKLKARGVPTTTIIKLAEFVEREIKNDNPQTKSDPNDFSTNG